MPVYNAEATLAESLQSIFRQTYPDYEVVVVDDGSQDQTPTLLARFAETDQRLKIYRFPANRGIVMALNYGLKRCKGHFIARMDADDRLLPERLALQLKFAQTHPQVDLIGSRFRLFRKDAPLTPAQLRYEQWSNRLLDDGIIKAEIFLESPIAHPTFFARRRFFERMDGYRDMPWAEDYDFLLRAWLKGAVFAKLPTVLVEKRDSPDRLYRTDPRCKRKAMLRAKAYFFTQGSWLNDGRKRLFLAGSGSSARTVAASLAQQGVGISGFIDPIPAPPDRQVMGIPAFYRKDDRVRTLLNQPEHNFFILCIGDPQGRVIQEDQLKTADLQPGQHYLRFL